MSLSYNYFSMGHLSERVPCEVGLLFSVGVLKEIGAVIGKEALINKQPFKGEHLLEKSHLLGIRCQIKTIMETAIQRLDSCVIKMVTISSTDSTCTMTKKI